MKPQPELLIVIATYNEIDNLPQLIVSLVQQLPNAEILVIDDGSPDGTGKWSEEAKLKYPMLSVVHRTDKQGLGSAALIGFQRALARDFQFVATMDADFSHDPTRLAALLAVLQNHENKSVGLVIGSRYVPDGKTLGWSLFRRLCSRSVNWFARWMLRLKTRDNSGAFRVYRCSALKRLDLAAMRSTDYCYLEEILWRLRRAGVPMIELPITFQNRIRGESKTSIKMGIRVFWQIFKMGIGRWK